MSVSAGEGEMSTSFIILRRETAGGYSTRGPIVQPMSLTDARAEIVRLKKQFPHQDFVIMGEVGEATVSERVTVKIGAPDLTEARPKKRKARKAAQPAPDWNVVPIRKENGG
jgi:hypothetical protein